MKFEDFVKELEKKEYEVYEDLIEDLDKLCGSHPVEIPHEDYAEEFWLDEEASPDWEDLGGGFGYMSCLRHKPTGVVVYPCSVSGPGIYWPSGHPDKPVMY